ncbi:hypothetical protein SCACP_40010 [Sporomusa carbonis]|uniref:hypothetical protein n=1 Tax=Sporomusa carbonis TaxID=3076075 RepID=UPI003A600C60
MNPVVEQIYSLKNEMIHLGYAEGEVNAFIHDVIGDKTIASLDSQECEELYDYLSSYVSFAKKSKNLILGSSK